MANVKRYRRTSKSSDDGAEDNDDYVPYVPVKERKKQHMMKLGRVVQLASETAQPKSSSENENDDDSQGAHDAEIYGRKYNISLLDQHTELINNLRRHNNGSKRAAEPHGASATRL